MNIIDVIVVLLILFGAVIGFKNGFTKQLFSFVGLLLIILIAFTLKNPISEFLYAFFPFFKFGGIIKGVTVLNILLYEVFAFVFIFSILMIGYNIILNATSIFERFLKMTIVLGIPSKILGMLVGMIEYLIVSYVVLLILSFPIFGNDILSGSKTKEFVLTKIPVMNNISSKTLEMADRFTKIKDKYQSEDNANEFNLETLDLFLEYKVVSVKNVEKLIEKDKLSLNGVESVLGKHR
jgi:Uncharacterized membrane protein, required for colicin V production